MLYRRRLRDGFKFSSEQVGVLIPNQRSGKSKTINSVEGNCRIAITEPPKSLEEEIVREITKRILQNRYGFSKDQVDALFSIQKNVQSESRFEEPLLCNKTTHKVPCSQQTLLFLIGSHKKLLKIWRNGFYEINLALEM